MKSRSAIFVPKSTLSGMPKEPERPRPVCLAQAHYSLREEERTAGKSEGRNPKAERRPKPEGRIQKPRITRITRMGKGFVRAEVNVPGPAIPPLSVLSVKSVVSTAVLRAGNPRAETRRPKTAGEAQNSFAGSDSFRAPI